jgi:hypothetical protein
MVLLGSWRAVRVRGLALRILALRVSALLRELLAWRSSRVLLLVVVSLLLIGVAAVRCGRLVLAVLETAVGWWAVGLLVLVLILLIAVVA